MITDKIPLHCLFYSLSAFVVQIVCKHNLLDLSGKTLWEHNQDRKQYQTESYIKIFFFFFKNAQWQAVCKCHLKPLLLTGLGQIEIGLDDHFVLQNT